MFWVVRFRHIEQKGPSRWQDPPDRALWRIDEPRFALPALKQHEGGDCSQCIDNKHHPASHCQTRGMGLGARDTRLIVDVDKGFGIGFMTRLRPLGPLCDGRDSDLSEPIFSHNAHTACVCSTSWG